MKRFFLNYFSFLFFLFPILGYTKPILNLYVWGGEIPKEVIRQFEKETGVQVHLSTYDNNETLFAKLKVSAAKGEKGTYDVILPSNYFVERLKRHGLITQLDHKQIPNLVNLDKQFLNSSYDPNNQYSVPLIWGTTGIFYNKSFTKFPPPTWQALWKKPWKKQLMLLDDMREVFAMSLLSLGFNPNDVNPEHIKLAYKNLLALIPNIKLFASESIQAIMIDEDAIAGMAWNADALKAKAENNNIVFSYPKEGFVIWVDCLAIPSNPPHPQEAYQFINFMLKAEIGREIALREGHAITNTKAKLLLPETLRNNEMIYPSEEVLKRAYYQNELSEEALQLYSFYWQQLKLAF